MWVVCRLPVFCEPFTDRAFCFPYILFFTFLYFHENITVGTLLSGHPPSSGHFPKSRIICQLSAVFDTSIQGPPLLSGRSHLFPVESLVFIGVIHF